MNLHEKISKRIDELERLAQRAYHAEPGTWALHHNPTRTGRADEWEIRDYDGDSLAWVGTENDARLIVRVADPATVLRGLADDRDILARHVPSYEMPTWPPGVPEESRRFLCAGCHGKRYHHDCPEVLSLARRHGIEVQP